MAMKTSSKPTELLNPRASRVAGIICTVFALCVEAGLILPLVLGGDQIPPQVEFGIVMGAGLALLAAGGGLVLGATRREWAQRLLLVFWLITAAVAAAVFIGCIFWGLPVWWTFPVPFPALTGALVVGSSIAVVLLIGASVSSSRLRYASMVAVSVVLGIAVVFVVNMIAQKDPIRKDVEMFRRWTLSDRTKAIVKDVSVPVRLTSLYVGGYQRGKDANEKLLRERRSRVWELLQQIAQQNRNIDVRNLTTDSERARLVDRLRNQLGGGAEKHIELLTRFQKQIPGIIKLLNEQGEQWSALSGDGYLAQWGLRVDIPRVMRNIAEKLNETSRTVARETGSLPDYRKITEDVDRVLEATRKSVSALQDLLKQIGQLPGQVKEGEKRATESLDEAVRSVEQIAQVVGKTRDPEPKDPAPVLEEIVTASEAAAEKLAQAKDALENIAGKERTALLLSHRGWLVDVNAGILRMRTGIPQGLALHREKILTELKGHTQKIAQAANTDYQKQYIVDLRKKISSYVESVRDLSLLASNAIRKVRDLDPGSKDQEILALGTREDLFRPILEAVTRLLDETDALPEIKSKPLPPQITSENIVIVEIGDKIEVVEFGEVWPLRSPVGPLGGGDEETRIFAGDTAIGSKVLKMTQEPFATVVLTYLEPPPQLRRIAFTPDSFSTLRKRLEGANFKVETWKLDEDPPPTSDKDPQKVLLVLPPPPNIPPSPYSPPMQGLKKERVEKIRKEIDAGTPGIFLVHSDFEPRLNGLASSYPLLNNYLRESWGVDVKSTYRVIVARRDETDPEKFRIDLGRWGYFPLSRFTDHPIGKPLQGHRTMWINLCPILTETVPEGVTVETVLSLGEYYNDVWATEDLGGLIAQIFSREQSLIAPRKQDIRPPFDLAVAASRAGDGQTKPTRITVLGFAPSLQDGYLDQPVLLINPDGTVRSQDPPSANAETVINSVYWCIGKQGYIAAGPMRTKPIAQLGKGAMTILQLLVVGMLPLGVLIAGGVVMGVRRR